MADGPTGHSGVHVQSRVVTVSQPGIDLVQAPHFLLMEDTAMVNLRKSRHVTMEDAQVTNVVF